VKKIFLFWWYLTVNTVHESIENNNSSVETAKNVEPRNKLKKKKKKKKKTRDKHEKECG
jgi:hypothetical protein